VRKIAGILPLAVAFSVLVAGIAVATPKVTIKSPASGATISRSATPKLHIKGGVRFDSAGSSTQTFYLRRDNCGTTADNPHLSVTSGTDVGDGCGLVVNYIGANDVTQVVQDYPSVAADGVPFALDATKPITGTFDIQGFLGQGQAGNMTVDFMLSGQTTAGNVTIGTDSETIMLDPTKTDQLIPINITPGAGFNKAQFASLNLETNIHGQNLLSGAVGLSGKSFFIVSTAGSAGSVQVSLDDANFAHPLTAKLGSTSTTYSLSIPTPTVGAHTIYVRAVQGSVQSAAVSRSFTVVP
jgi:hypothetical protein